MGKGGRDKGQEESVLFPLYTALPLAHSQAASKAQVKGGGGLSTCLAVVPVKSSTIQYHVPDKTQPLSWATWSLLGKKKVSLGITHSCTCCGSLEAQ